MDTASISYVAVSPLIRHTVERADPDALRIANHLGTLAYHGVLFLAKLIAMADTDEVVRLRLLRAIRDLGV
jgi:hypothetical protein